MEPRIRLQGFDGDWSNDTIGNIAMFSKGRGYSKSDLKSAGNPLILYGRLYTNYSAVIKSVDTYATLKTGSVLSKGNEVIMPGSGETPEDIAVASAVEQKGVILGGDLNIVTFNPDKIVPAFAAMSITNSKTHRELSGYAQGKTVVHLHNSNIAKGHISYPTKDEQLGIAAYISSLDDLIQSTTKKIESLKQVKAASLQSMFPQEGETAPRVRFKGFEGDWKEDMANNLCKIGTGKSNTQDQIEEGKYPFYIRSEKVMRSNKYLYDCEAVITIGDGNIGRVFHYVKGKFDLHQRCYKMTEFQKVLGIYFFYYFSSSFYDRAIKMSAKATVDSVRLDMIANMPILYPESIEEQQAIADYFTNLDSLITSQTQRLDQLKQIKSACLDNMFV